MTHNTNCTDVFIITSQQHIFLYLCLLIIISVYIASSESQFALSGIKSCQNMQMQLQIVIILYIINYIQNIYILFFFGDIYFL